MGLLDRILIELDHCLKTVTLPAHTDRPFAEADVSNEQPLSQRQQRYSAGLMRVNHCGEVCAQALYRAQAFTAKQNKLADSMLRSAKEEVDHLAWCGQRLSELDSRPSYLNPLWYAGSFAMGVMAGFAGDAYSLGFIAETENQVTAHLGRHTQRLPSEDKISLAIVQQMQKDEAEHAVAAQAAGAVDLPVWIKFGMRHSARVMTSLSFYC